MGIRAELALKETKDRRDTRDLLDFPGREETKVKSVWRARRETWASKANADTSDQPVSMELRVPRVQKDQRVHQVKLDPSARLERRERSVSPDLLGRRTQGQPREPR